MMPPIIDSDFYEKCWACEGTGQALHTDGGPQRCSQCRGFRLIARTREELAQRLLGKPLRAVIREEIGKASIPLTGNRDAPNTSERAAQLEQEIAYREERLSGNATSVYSCWDRDLLESARAELINERAKLERETPPLSLPMPA